MKDRNRNYVACVCACGRRIRVARRVLSLAPIICGRCDKEFEPDPPLDEPGPGS